MLSNIVWSMAISWAENVNQRILDSTQINIGEGGYVEDKASSGEFKERRLTSLSVPDTFSVVMDFDWLEKDVNGLSEFDRFIIWYKYIHKRGTKPFYFPSITKFNVNGSIVRTNPVTKEKELCQYKITSGIKPQKSGFSMRCSMIWEEVYSGTGIYVLPKTCVLDRMIVQNGHIKTYFNITPSKPKEATDFQIQAKKIADTDYEDIPITAVTNDGNITHIYFDDLQPSTYFIKVTCEGVTLYDGLEV